MRGSDGSHSKFKPSGPLICSKGSAPRLEMLSEPSRRSRKEALVDRLDEEGASECLRPTYRESIRPLRKETSAVWERSGDNLPSPLQYLSQKYLLQKVEDTWK